MGHIIIMAQVHGFRIRTPQPSRQRGLVALGFGYLQRRRIRLPEILHGHTHSTGHVAYKGIAVGPLAVESTNPGIIIIGPFAHGETFRRRLRQPVGIPCSPFVDEFLIRFVECVIGRHTLTQHLLLLYGELSPMVFRQTLVGTWWPVLTRLRMRQPQFAPSVERLHRFAPHAAVAG